MAPTIRIIEWVMHLFIWVLFFFLSYGFTSRVFPVDIAFRISSCTALLLALTAYTNVFLLLPLFFNTGRFAAYILSTIALVGSVVYLNLESHNYFSPEGLQAPFRMIEDGTYPTIPASRRWSLRMIPITFMTIAVLFISTVYHQARSYLEKERHQAFLQAENVKHELSFLRAQINPHFLFNALNNLHATIQLKPELAAGFVLRLADLLRYGLIGAQEKTVSMSDEIAYLNNYLFFQAQKGTGQAKVKFDYHNVEIPDYKIEPMLLIPIIENAFVHSYATNSELRFIDIQLSFDHNLLKFEVRNNIGETQLKEKAGFGIGLSNVRRRLDLLYPQLHQLECSIKDQVHIACLDLQLNHL